MIILIIFLILVVLFVWTIKKTFAFAPSGFLYCVNHIRQYPNLWEAVGNDTLNCPSGEMTLKILNYDSDYIYYAVSGVNMKTTDYMGLKKRFIGNQITKILIRQAELKQIQYDHES